MKVRLFALMMVLAAALCTPASSVAQSADHGVGDRGIYQTTMPNGLHVLTVENHSAPVVETAVWYHFGSLDERRGKTGLAHALEHMMFRGTASLSAGGLTDAVARLGAQMNAQTDYDYTQFYFIMPADKLDVALRIEADRMHDLGLKQSEWDVERLAVLNELDGDASSPFYNLLSRVRAAAYPDSAFARTPAGLRDDVAKAGAADIAAYYKQWYSPNNATLVIAGDVDHRTVDVLAKKLFGGIPKKTVPQHRIEHPAAATGKTVEADFPFPFEILDLAYAIPGDSEPGEPAISALSKLISNERSPFYQSLVETNVALSVDANADTQLHGGLMNVFIVLNPGHSAVEAQTIFQNTMDSALKNGFDPDLVLAAKRQTLAERTYSADSIGGYGDLVGYTYGIVAEKVADEDNRLADLTPQMLLDAAKKYLATPNVVGHLRPSDRPAHRNSQKSDATVSDNFTGRVPSGPIVQPAVIRAELATPTKVRSKLSPTQFTLPNGLHVIVQEKHDRPTVYIGGAIESSPAFVPHGEEGIADLASTLANFGSEKYDFTALRKRSDEIGAVVSLGQRFEAHGFAHDFETLLDILADGEAHPAFSNRWLDLQRAQLANSIETQNQISGVMIQRSYLQKLVAPGDPAARYATAASVGGITRDDLLAYTARYWRPDLTTVVVVGDVTPQRVRAAMQNTFGSWHASGAKPATALQPLPPAHSAHDYIGTDANQVFVQLGQPATSRTNPDYPAFQLLNEIIGGSGYFESRLWQELRQKRGLVYSVQSELRADASRGDLEITLNASPEKIVPAMHLVRQELERLANEPVSQTELQEAKTRVVSAALLNEASADGQVDELLGIGTLNLPLNYDSTLSERFSSVSAADIQRVAKTYLHPDKLIQIFAGPSGPWTLHGI